MEIEKFLDQLEAAAHDPQQLIDVCRKCLHVDYVSYLALTFPKPRGSSFPAFASNYPVEWIRHYIEQDYLQKDPALLRVSDSFLPVDWTTLDKTSAIDRQIFGEAHEFGIPGIGVSVPLRGLRGEVAVVSLAADFSPKTWRDYLNENIRIIDVASSLLHTHILHSNQIDDSRPKLTKRETECLYWTSQGKTCADVAEILNISENTARFYLTSARNKMNCQTITHCVARAISMRIIPPVV